METAQQPTPTQSFTPGNQLPELQKTTVVNIQRKTLSSTQLFIIFLLLLLPIIGFGGYFFGQKSPAVVTPITSASPLPSESPLIDPGMDGTLAPNVLPLVAVSYTGGLCVTGSTCENSMQVMPNGNVISNGELTHTISAAETQALLENIASADYGQMREAPFTGTCPIAYDGQEKIYKFYVAGREEILPSCTYDIESLPLIKQVDAALESPAIPDQSNSTSSSTSPAAPPIGDSQPGSEGPVMCTMEAKMCPDGSYVGRSGPKCEFTPCP